MLFVYYKNSIPALILSIFGCAMVCGGIAVCLDGEYGGVAMVLIGALLFLWGRRISQNKAFKVWWKQITDANLEPEITRSIQIAVEIYNKNPQQRTLKKIAELNPAAAEYIENDLAEKKKK